MTLLVEFLHTSILLIIKNARFYITTLSIEIATHMYNALLAQ